MKKVLLLSMPFGALERQALGLSLLKAKLREAGIDCQVRYLTFSFAEFIGYEEYQWLSFELPYTAFAGDWSFTRSLYGERPEADRRYLQEVLRDTWRLNESAIARILRIRSLVPHFLDYCLQILPWQEYALVGFTSTFEQNLASLALARRLKEIHPEIAIVFGGANWEGEMGCELHRQFPFVDYVCCGEAEESFPALVRHVLGGLPGRDVDIAIPGIIYRKNGETIYTGQADLVRDMDALPVPDFTDYFADLAQSTVAASIAPTLLFETSRGCWWGAKSHCTFCGLNGGTMTFRSKSAHRVLDELDHLTSRWQIGHVEVVDNILDMKYFKDVLPALARARRPLQFFYEVKANLTRKQVRLLSEAGVYRIQPGIESLNDHVLKLMRKGTTALRNIQLLKWCQEYSVTVDWNLLHGFPGETAEDYASMLSLLPAIRFLRPPGACAPIRLDRFSPYFTAPAEFGLQGIRPIAAYRYLYPFDEESLHRIAYYFDFDYAPHVDPSGYAQQVVEYVRSWQQQPEMGTLFSVARPDGSLMLIDTRSTASQREFVLAGYERAAYEYCDVLSSATAVVQHLHGHFPHEQVVEGHVLDLLAWFVANRLMVSDGQHYLSLAIPAQPVEAASDRSMPFVVDATASEPRPLHSYLPPVLNVFQPEPVS